MSEIRHKQEAQAKKEIVSAILSYSPDRLQNVIDDYGAATLGHPLMSVPRVLQTYDSSPDEDQIDTADVIAIHTDGFTFPLHIAVACVYRAIKNRRQRNEALRTIDVLISNGADIHLGTGCIYLLNIQGYIAHSFDRNWPDNHPVHLAMFLKRYPWSFYESETDEYLDKVIKKFDDAASVLKSQFNEKKIKMQTTQVLKGVALSYEKLLSSEEFSDVTFVCSDGVSVPAHKAILAASSDYFNTAFRGPWAENNVDGVWKTSHPSTLIKAVLKILYTGSDEKCDELLKDEEVDQMALFELSSEFGIDMLITLTTNNCIQSINKKTLKEYLVKGNFYSNEKLKKACFDFIQLDVTTSLTSPDIMALASEEVDLWSELTTYLKNDGKTSRKRTRQN